MKEDKKNTRDDTTAGAPQRNPDRRCREGMLRILKDYMHRSGSGEDLKPPQWEVNMRRRAARKKADMGTYCISCGKWTTSTLPKCWKGHFEGTHPEGPLCMCTDCIKKNCVDSTEHTSPHRKSVFVMGHKTALKGLGVKKGQFPGREHMKDGNRRIGKVFIYFGPDVGFCCDQTGINESV